MLLFLVIEILFTLKSEGLKLGPADVQLPLSLVELILQSLVLLHLLLKIHSMAGFQVLLNLHA